MCDKTMRLQQSWLCTGVDQSRLLPHRIKLSQHMLPLLRSQLEQAHVLIW
mgnify:CR=1 FL=1